MHISEIKCRKNIYVKCPDGFSNQLRLMLAGVFLKIGNYVETYNVNWVLNNHNNISFLEYFKALPLINFNCIDFTKIDKSTIIDTCSFESMIRTITKKPSKIFLEDALRFSLNYLQPRQHIQILIDNFIKENHIKNCLGVHVRRTCKTALLQESSKRLYNTLLSNENILNITKNYNYVYLATDNMETQKWFKSKLKNKLIIFEDIKSGLESFEGNYDRKLVQRHTTPLNTVADFLILKECSSFLGTSESSFSLLIKYWRNNKNDYPIFGKL